METEYHMVVASYRGFAVLFSYSKLEGEEQYEKQIYSLLCNDL